MPSLRSEPVALHVSVSVMYGVIGLTDTGVIVGTVFCIVAVATSVSEPPYASLAWAVQEMVSPTPTSAGLKVMDDVFPKTVLPLVHS